ncbi:uncharacterized protein LOC124196675 [Daphnia pulex]|uniref:uncharacterized protein LOC124196675 n=1 Tax=Daphnia pulex TaxID=6669 RepID=UPI001EDE0B50|nr:uncharacterized protein LOC124196675 [Daphnia pulex]
MLIMWPEHLYILPRCRLFFLLVKSELRHCCPIPNVHRDFMQPAGKGCSSCYLYCYVFRQMKKHEQLKFIVDVREVAVRCGTLLQPMLVISFSASNSIGRSLVLVCYRSCIIILLNCHRDYCSLPFRSSEATKTNMGCLCQTNNKHVFGIGKGEDVGGGIFQVWIQKYLIHNPINISLPINLQTPLTYTYQP